MSKDNKKTVKAFGAEKDQNIHMDTVNLCSAIREHVVFDGTCYFPLGNQAARSGFQVAPQQPVPLMPPPQVPLMPPPPGPLLEPPPIALNRPQMAPPPAVAMNPPQSGPMYIPHPDQLPPHQVQMHQAPMYLLPEQPAPMFQIVPRCEPYRQICYCGTIHCRYRRPANNHTKRKKAWQQKKPNSSNEQQEQQLEEVEQQNPQYQNERQQQSEPPHGPRSEMPQQAPIPHQQIPLQHQNHANGNVERSGGYMPPPQEYYVWNFLPDTSVPPPPLGMTPARVQTHNGNHPIGPNAIDPGFVHQFAQPGQNPYPVIQKVPSHPRPLMQQVLSEPIRQMPLQVHQPIHPQMQPAIRQVQQQAHVPNPQIQRSMPPLQQQVQQPIQQQVHVPAIHRQSQQPIQPMQQQAPHHQQRDIRNYGQQAPNSSNQQMIDTHLVAGQVALTSNVNSSSSNEQRRNYQQQVRGSDVNQQYLPQGSSQSALQRPGGFQMPQQPEVQRFGQHNPSSSNQQPGVSQRQLPPADMNHQYPRNQQAVHPPGFAQMPQQPQVQQFVQHVPSSSNQQPPLPATNANDQYQPLQNQQSLHPPGFAPTPQQPQVQQYVQHVPSSSNQQPPLPATNANDQYQPLQNQQSPHPPGFAPTPQQPQVQQYVQHIPSTHREVTEQAAPTPNAIPLPPQVSSQQPLHPPSHSHTPEQQLESDAADHRPIHQQQTPPSPNNVMSNHNLANQPMGPQQAVHAPILPMAHQGFHPFLIPPGYYCPPFGPVHPNPYFAMQAHAHYQQIMQNASRQLTSQRDDPSVKPVPISETDSSTVEENAPLPDETLPATLAEAHLQITTDHASGEAILMEQNSNNVEETPRHMSVSFPTPPYSVQTSSTRAHSVEEFTFGYDDSLGPSTSNRVETTIPNEKVVETPILVKSTPATSGTSNRAETTLPIVNVVETPILVKSTPATSGTSNRAETMLQKPNVVGTPILVKSTPATSGTSNQAETTLPVVNVVETPILVKSTPTTSATLEKPVTTAQSSSSHDVVGTSSAQNTSRNEATAKQKIGLATLTTTSQKDVSSISLTNGSNVVVQQPKPEPVKPKAPMSYSHVTQSHPKKQEPAVVKPTTSGPVGTQNAQQGPSTSGPQKTPSLIESSTPVGRALSSATKQPSTKTIAGGLQPKAAPSIIVSRQMTPQQTKPVSDRKPHASAAPSKAVVATKTTEKPTTPSAAGNGTKTDKVARGNVATASQKASDQPNQMQKPIRVTSVSEQGPTSKHVKPAIMKKSVPATGVVPEVVEVSSSQQAAPSPSTSKKPSSEPKPRREPCSDSVKVANVPSGNKVDAKASTSDRLPGTSQKKAKKPKPTKKKKVEDNRSEDAILQEAMRVAEKEREELKKNEVPSEKPKQPSNQSENKKKLEEKIKKCSDARTSNRPETSGTNQRWYELGTGSTLVESIKNYDAARNEEMRCSQSVKAKNEVDIDSVTEKIMNNILGDSPENKAAIQSTLNSFSNCVLENMLSRKAKEFENNESCLNDEFYMKVAEFLLEHAPESERTPEKRREVSLAALNFLAERIKQVPKNTILHELYNGICYQKTSTWIPVLFYFSKQPKDKLPELEAEFVNSFASSGKSF